MSKKNFVAPRLASIPQPKANTIVKKVAEPQAVEAQLKPIMEQDGDFTNIFVLNRRKEKCFVGYVKPVCKSINRNTDESITRFTICWRDTNDIDKQWAGHASLLIAAMELVRKFGKPAITKHNERMKLGVSR